MTRTSFRAFFIIGLMWGLTACKAGGNLTLEPGARRTLKQGAPSSQLNLGGKALVVESGKTATTGVHGWITVQPMVSRTLSSSPGTTLKLNTPRPVD